MPNDLFILLRQCYACAGYLSHPSWKKEELQKYSGDEQKILRAKGMAASYNGESLHGGERKILRAKSNPKRN